MFNYNPLVGADRIFNLITSMCPQIQYRMASDIVGGIDRVMFREGKGAQIWSKEFYACPRGAQ